MTYGTPVAATVFLAALIPSFPPLLRGQELSYRAVDVTERVIVFVPNERGVGNAVAIIGDDGVFVVDATATPKTAREMLAAIRRRTSLPIRAVILTHWHDDHVWGAQAFLAADPSVEIIAHQGTRVGMIEFAVPGLEQNIQRLGARIEERDSILRSSRENGEPITAERRTALDARQALFRDFLTQLEGVEPKLPTLIVGDTLSIFSGDLFAQVIYAGRGHTAGDLVVHVVSEDVFVAGDLLTHPFPAAAGAFVPDWVGTLARLRARGASVIIPGHGPIQRDDTYANQVQRLLEAVTRQATQAHAEGLTVDEALDGIDVAEFRVLMVDAGDAAAARAFERFFLRPAIESVYVSLPPS